MALAPALAASGLIASSVLWLAWLAGGTEDLAAGPAILLGADLVLLSVVAAAGLLIAHSRWARTIGALIALAPLTFLFFEPEPDSLFWLAVAIAVLTVAAVLSPAVRRWTKAGHPGPGPPAIAAALLIVLLLSPAVSAMASPSGATIPLWLLATAGPLAAFGYSRASVGVLWAIRIVALPLAIAAATAAPRAGAALLIGYGITVTTLSWQKKVLLAAQPLAPLPSPGYRIPPEMAPSEILEAADLDETGRPRR